MISAGGEDSGPAFSTDVSFKGRCTNSRGKIFQTPLENNLLSDLNRQQCFKKCIDLETAGEDVEVFPTGVTIESPKVTGITYEPIEPFAFCYCEIDTDIFPGPVTGAFNGGQYSTAECYRNAVRPFLILQHLILIIRCPSSYCLDCRIELWFVYSVHFRRCVQRQN